jgi:hypothetical protein
VTRSLRAVVWGTEDPRVRATYRVLVPMLLSTSLLTPLSQRAATLVIPPGSPLPTAMLVTGLFQAVLVAAVLVAWARYVDRRSLANYGFSVSGAWVLDLAVAVGAVLVGHALWFAVASPMGWVDVTFSPSAPDGAFAVGFVAVLVALAANVWVQETIFVVLPVRNAAEGLASRGVTPPRAVLAAWVTATLLFTVAHGRSGLGPNLNLLVALGVYALLYVHSGSVASPVGVHLGVNASGGLLFAPPSMVGSMPTVFQVTGTLQGLAGTLSDGRIPQILVGYVLLLAWHRVRTGEVSIRTDLAEWVGR